MIKTNIDSATQGFFKFTDLSQFIFNFIKLTIGVASIVTLVYLFLGGLQYIQSGGNQDQAKSAKDKITQAIIGLGLVAVVWVFWRLAMYFLGLSSSLTGPFQVEVPTP